MLGAPDRKRLGYMLVADTKQVGDSPVTGAAEDVVVNIALDPRGVEFAPSDLIPMSHGNTSRLDLDGLSGGIAHLECHIRGFCSQENRGDGTINESIQIGFPAHAWRPALTGPTTMISRYAIGANGRHSCAEAKQELGKNRHREGKLMRNQKGFLPLSGMLQGTVDNIAKKQDEKFVHGRAVAQ